MALRNYLAVSLLAAAAAYADDPFFLGLGHLPGGPWNDSEGVAISGDGSVITGTSNSQMGREAFRWTLETGVVGLGFLPGGGAFSMARDISADGSTIVGFSHSEASEDIHPGAYEAFRWTEADGMVGLGVTPNEWFTDATAVSGDGSVIVGNTFFQRPFKWTAEEGMTELLIPKPDYGEAIALAISIDGRRIVGGITSADRQTREAVIWDGEDVLTLGDLPGGPVHSRAEGASADGSVVIGTGDANHMDGLGLRDEAFRWTAEGGMVGLGDLPSDFFFSTAVAVSGDGSTVVGMGSAEEMNLPYIWDAEHGMRELMPVLAAEYGLDFTGWDLFQITDMSADGRTFLGTARNPDGEGEAWIAYIGDGDDCYADFTGDGVLDLFDFLAYVNGFNAGEDGADCTGDGALDLFDFLCFVNAFNQGC